MLEVSLFGERTVCYLSNGMRTQRANGYSKQQMITPPPPVVGFRPFSGVGVGWQVQCTVCLALRELDIQRAGVFSRFIVLAVTEVVIQLHHVRRGEARRVARGLV